MSTSKSIELPQSRESFPKGKVAPMHELAISESVVEEVRARVGDARVVRVVLEVGRLAAVAPDALRFSFDVCARGTSLEGSALDIIETSGRARCRRCGLELEVIDVLPFCVCGSADLAVTGHELRLREVEVI